MGFRGESHPTQAEASNRIVTIVLLLLGSYLIGALPTSYLIGRAHGIDLRNEGSGNLGTSNVLRVLGLIPALVVLPIDILKGFLPVWYFPQWDGAVGHWGFAYGLAAIIGHIWSVYVGFRGGKGVATAAGALLALTPLAAVTGLLVWVGILLITRIPSVASLVAASTVPVVAYMAEAPGYTVLFATSLATLVWWTHRENVRRLAHREELKLQASHTANGNEEG